MSTRPARSAAILRLEAAYPGWSVRWRHYADGWLLAGQQGGDLALARSNASDLEAAIISTREGPGAWLPR